MLDLTNHVGLLPLVQCVEYTMLLIYILTKIQLNPLKLSSYLSNSFLFCIFVVLLCIVRVIRNMLLLLEICQESEVLLNASGFAAYFTIFSLIAKCWHVKYIKNSFSIPPEEKPLRVKRAGLYFLSANIFIYSGLCVLYILLLQGIFSDYTREQISLNIYIFRILGKLILTFGLVTGGIRLLKTVNYISVIKPTKLKLFVYLIIVVSVWTTLALIIMTIMLFQNRLYSTNPNMLIISFVNNNISEVLPIILLSPVVKAWKACSNSTSRATYSDIEDKLYSRTTAEVSFIDQARLNNNS